MKKAIFLLLALVMILALAACGENTKTVYPPRETPRETAVAEAISTESAEPVKPTEEEPSVSTAAPTTTTVPPTTTTAPPATTTARPTTTTARPTTTTAPKPNPVEKLAGNYYGTGYCERASATVTVTGWGTAKIVFEWGGGATESSKWVIEGRYDEQTRTISYSNCQYCVCHYGDNGAYWESDQSKTSGSIVFRADGRGFSWTDSEVKTWGYGANQSFLKG